MNIEKKIKIRVELTGDEVRDVLLNHILRENPDIDDLDGFQVVATKLAAKASGELDYAVFEISGAA